MKIWILIMTYAINDAGSAAQIHSIEFQGKGPCEVARQEWLADNKPWGVLHANAICVSRQ